MYKGEAIFLVVVNSFPAEVDGMWNGVKCQKPKDNWDYYIDTKEGFDCLNLGQAVKGFQPLYKFGQWMLAEGHVDIGRQSWFEQSCLSPSTLLRLKEKQDGTADLTTFINEALPGFKTVRVGPNNPDITLTYREGEDRALRQGSEDTGAGQGAEGIDTGQEDQKPKKKEGSPIVSVTWITPWARLAWQAADYIQLDCSFKGAKPFVYCVPQAIICNEAVPLGFIITPTETAKTYDWFCYDLRKSNVEGPKTLKRQIILSDEGLGLKKFCKRFQLSHFFCHRHPIEKFGARGYIGSMVRQALACKTQGIYLELRTQLLVNADRLHQEGKITGKALKAFKKFLTKEFVHGMWHRAPYGVARCSNHAERFHGVINAMVRDVKSLPKRLRIIAEYITRKYADYGTLTGRRQLNETVATLIRHGQSNAAICCRSNCKVYRKMMRRRFGVKSFPCRHVVKYWESHLKSSSIAPLPSIEPSGKELESRVLVQHVPLFKVQAHSKEFKRWHRRVKHSLTPRSEAPDEDEANSETTPAVLSCPIIGSDYCLAGPVVLGRKFLIDSHGDDDGDLVALSALILDAWKRDYAAFLDDQSKRQREDTDTDTIDDGDVEKPPVFVPSEESKRLWVARFSISWWTWAQQKDRPEAPTPLPPDNSWAPEDKPKTSQRPSRKASRQASKPQVSKRRASKRLESKRTKAAASATIVPSNDETEQAVSRWSESDPEDFDADCPAPEDWDSPEDWEQDDRLDPFNGTLAMREWYGTAAAWRPFRPMIWHPSGRAPAVNPWKMPRRSLWPSQAFMPEPVPFSFGTIPPPRNPSTTAPPVPQQQPPPHGPPPGSPHVPPPGPGPHPHTTVNFLPVGLPNFGSTCFYNAVLQCLFSITEFRLFFQESTFPQSQLATQYKTFQTGLLKSAIFETFPM
jgi:hypothetical protein